MVAERFIGLSFFFDVCKNRLYSKEKLSGNPDIENSQIVEPAVEMVQYWRRQLSHLPSISPLVFTTHPTFSRVFYAAPWPDNPGGPNGFVQVLKKPVQRWLSWNVCRELGHGTSPDHPRVIITNDDSAQ
jgi:hypothetical protein